MNPHSPSTAVDTFAVGPFQENTFLLRAEGSSDLIVIDPGEDAERLTQFIDDHKYKPVAIVNTHAHLDHIGAVEPLKKHFGIPFYLHHADREILAAAPEHARLFGVREPEVPEIDFELAADQVLELAGLKLRVLHTPGHTPGGVSLHVGGRVFAGDTLFYGSIGRTDLPGGDFQTLIKSIEEQLLALPDETVVHSGHGPDTTIGREREYNPFLTGEVPLGF